MKKTKVSMLVAVTIALTSTISFGATGKVNTDTARMRSEASSDSSIVDLLSIDDKVEILENSGDWYKVKAGEKTGYVSKSLLDVEGEVAKTEKTEEADTSENKEESKEEKTEEPVSTDNEQEVENVTENETTESIIKEKFTGKLSQEITIKILPTINSIDIAKLEPDQEIKVVEVINDWCHIETDKLSGWTLIKKAEEAVSTSVELVQEEISEENQEEAQETEINKTGFVSVESVNLRKEKSTDSEKLDSLTKNTEVTILAEDGEWYKVKVKNQTGYVAKKYISDQKVEEVTSRASDTARQITESKEESEAEISAPTASGEENDVVAYAKQYLGYNYVSGGKSPSSGFDCSGFTSYVYRQFGVDLSGSSTGQRNAGTSVSKSELQPGDLLIFNNSSNSSVGHVGIYIGNNEFIHAANARKGVITTSLSDSYYEARYVDGRRVIE